jgi:LPS sulfotransferase NodH
VSCHPPPAVARAFVVGCPRSGTTLLQSLLFAHTDVVSFPETFFFVRILPSAHERLRRRLHVVSAMAPRALTELDSLGVPADAAPPRLPSVTVGGYAKRFVRRMDRAAVESGARLWVEKTPRHARHVAAIERHVPGAHFVHIVRTGEAVAASLRDAHDQDPEVWKASQPLDLVAIWRRYLSSTVACVGRPNHAFVRYERLVADPVPVLRAVCEFLGLAIDGPIIDDMVAGYGERSQRVTGRVKRVTAAAMVAAEPWKADTDGEITNRNEAKFRRLFTEDERAEIVAAVAEAGPALASIPFV